MVCFTTDVPSEFSIAYSSQCCQQLVNNQSGKGKVMTK